MQLNDLVDRVRVIIGEVCGVEASQILSDVRLATYGFDSVRAMNLLVALEEAFGISVPDEVAPRMRTMRDVVAYLEKRLAPPSTLRGSQGLSLGT
jgi:acyl carrier protein